MTAAPFFEGTYQPWSRSPSLVVNQTSSNAVPSCRGRDVGTGRMGDDVRLRDREEDEVEPEEEASARPHASRTASHSAALPRLPQREDARYRRAACRPESPGARCSRRRTGRSHACSSPPRRHPSRHEEPDQDRERPAKPGRRRGYAQAKRTKNAVWTGRRRGGHRPTCPVAAGGSCRRRRGAPRAEREPGEPGLAPEGCRGTCRGSPSDFDVGCARRRHASLGARVGTARRLRPAPASRRARGAAATRATRAGTSSSRRAASSSPGRRIARTIVASIRIAAASPTPNCLKIII